MPFTHRRLPHLYTVGRPLFVTFRLHGSLSPGRSFTSDTVTSGAAFLLMDRLLDRQRDGPLYLRMAPVAGLVAEAIEQAAGKDYHLHQWAIMPNHVHLLVTPLAAVPDLLRRLKGATARRANQMLSRTREPFWQQESYDRLVRDAHEFTKIGKYIVNNPVTAGLARTPEEYKWSSGFRVG